MVHEVLPNSNGIIWKIVVKYRNEHEFVDRFTTRAVREFVLIHPVDEESGKMTPVAYMKQNLNNKH